jgi:hypothetical protein
VDETERGRRQLLRAGAPRARRPFNPDGNNGYNIESLRDFNNAGPKIAFGFETQPGHGASSEPRRVHDPSQQHRRRERRLVGGTTYGGTGVYGAQIGGVWDALLGEGRNWWFFASSDWHNRGMFGPDDRVRRRTSIPANTSARSSWSTTRTATATRRLRT